MGGLFEAVDPGVVAAGESVGEGFFEADLLFAGAGFWGTREQRTSAAGLYCGVFLYGLAPAAGPVRSMNSR